MSRHPFTAKEDDFLATYIAKYNPQPQGRLGNNLYKSLEDNPKKWPWSKTHSWQSWRERYKKNQEVIDRKILRIQKGKGKKKEEEESEAREAPVPAELEPKKIVQKKNIVVTSSKQAERSAAPISNPTKDIPPKPVGGEPSQGVRPPESVEATASKPSTSRIVANSEHHNRSLPKQQTAKQTSDDFNNREKVKSAALNVPPIVKIESTQSHSHPVINSLLEVVDLTKEESLNDDLMHELFGSDDEESEVDELQSTHSTRSPPPSPKPPQSKVTKHIAKENDQGPEIAEGNPSQEPTPPTSGAEAAHVPTLRTPLKKAKSRPKPRKARDEDPFGTPSPSPLAKTRLKSPVVTKSILPVLVNNGFRNVLKRPRPSTDNEEGSVWPPKRAKSKAFNVAAHAHDESPDQMDVDEPEPTKMSRETKEPVQSKSAQVNVVASSSTTKHRPPAALEVPKVVNQPQPVQPWQVPATTVSNTNSNIQPPAASPSLQAIAHPVQPRPVQAKTVAKPFPLISPPQTVVPAVLKEPKKPVQPRPVQVNAVASSSTSKLNPASVHAVPLNPPKSISPEARVSPKSKAVKPHINALNAISRTSSTFTLPEDTLIDNDPFTAYIVPGKTKANPPAETTRIPQVDLRKRSLQRRFTNNTGSISAHRSSGHTSRASSVTSTRTKGSATDVLRKSLASADLSVTSINFAVAATREITQIVLKIGSACGVKDEIALKTYENVQSLEKTKFMLEKYKEAMTEMEKKLYSADPALRHFFDTKEESQVRGEEDSDDEIPEGLVVRDPDSPIVQKSIIRKSHNKTSSKRSRASGRPSLNIRPLPIEDELTIEDNFTPMPRSRAASFARLAKQGRIEEAREREGWRLSGLHYSQMQTEDDQGTVTRQSLPSAHPSEAPVSPSPKSRLREVSMEADAEEVDDVDVGVMESRDPDVDMEIDVGHDDDDDVDDGELAPDIEFGVAAESDHDVDIEGRESDDDVVENDELELNEAGADEHGVPSDTDDDDDDPEKQKLVDNKEVADDEEPVFAEIPTAQRIKEEDDDDNIYVKDETLKHEADDESDDAEENQGDLESSPLYPSTRTLIKRLSGGRENEPEFKAETEEHRQLALGVSEENKEELRKFEENHNSDLLRLWSLKWMREIMAIKPLGGQEGR